MQFGRNWRTSASFLAALLLSLSAWFAFAQYSGPWSNGWKYGFKPGGSVTAIVGESAYGPVYYAATPGAIWKSGDSGDHWMLLVKSPPRMERLAWDAGAGVVYAASSYQAWKSTDHGANWSLIFRTPPIPKNTPKLTGLAAAGNTVYLAFEKSAIGMGPLFMSSNAGTTWVSITPGTGSVALRGIFDMAMDPFQPSILYVASPTYYYDGGGYWASVCMTFLAPCGVFASYGGPLNNWTGMGWGGGTPRKVFTERDAQGLIFAADGGGSISKRQCVNGTCGWMQDAPLAKSQVTHLLVDGCLDFEMFAGTDDFGVGIKPFQSPLDWSWPDATKGFGQNDSQLKVQTMALHCPGGALVGMPAGIWGTADIGSSWTRKDAGITGADVNSIAVAPGPLGIVYAASTSGGVARSMDGGNTWVDASNGLDTLSLYGERRAMRVETVAVNRWNPLMVVAATNYGIYRSSDGAKNWTRATSFDPAPSNNDFPHAPTVKADPVVPGRFYALVNGGSSLMVSGDNGAGWHQVGTAPWTNGYRDADALALSPMTYPMYLAAPGGVQVLREPGSGWQETLTGFVIAVAVDPRQPNVVYAGGIGMWKSTDFGATWRPIRNIPYGVIFAVALDNTSSLYIALHGAAPIAGNYTQTTGGVWRSRDGGATWHDLGARAGVDVSGLAFDNYRGAILAGTSGFGVGIRAEPTSPILEANPPRLVFTAAEGGRDPQPQNMRIANTGAGNLTWTATSDRDWLVVRQAAGVVQPDASINVPVQVNTSELKAGTYYGSIHVTARGAQGSPSAIGVTVNVVGGRPGSPPKH